MTLYLDLRVFRGSQAGLSNPSVLPVLSWLTMQIYYLIQISILSNVLDNFERLRKYRLETILHLFFWLLMLPYVGRAFVGKLQHVHRDPFRRRRCYSTISRTFNIFSGL